VRAGSSNGLLSKWQETLNTSYMRVTELRVILWWWWQMFSTSQMRVNQLSKYFCEDGDRLLLVHLEEVIQLWK